jgi:hypothetical protein
MEPQLDIKKIVQIALSVSERRKEVLLRLREALEANDVAKVITLAKELCGLYDQERHRADSRLDRGAGR